MEAPPPPAAAVQAPPSEAVDIPFAEIDVDYTSVSDSYDELAACAGSEQAQERGIYVASRMDLLVRLTLLRGTSRRSASADLKHGSYSFEPPRFRSVSSLSSNEQTALHRQMRLLCAAFLGLVVVPSRLSFIFLFVAAFIKRAAASYQAVFTLGEVSPVSPVKGSFVSYLIAAIVQVAIYSTSGEATFVTRNGLIGCLLAEPGLVLYLLWDLSQMWRLMTKAEMPRVLVYVHADLLMLYIAIFTFVSTLPLLPCMCTLSYCIGASSEPDTGGDVGMTREITAAARGVDEAVLTKEKQQQQRGDRLYQNKRRAQ